MDVLRRTAALDGMRVGLFSKDEHSVLEDAEGLIEKARVARPDKAPAAWAKAQEYLEKHRPRVKEDLSGLADRYVSVGSGLMDLKDRTGALSAWNKALEVHARHLPAFHALARAFEDADNAQEATKYLDWAIDANPAEPRALEAKASFLVRHHETAGAAELYRKLHELNPDEMKWVAELTELDPTNGTWWLARAKIAHKLKQGADAMAWTLKAAALAPDDPLPRVYESLLTEEGGDPRGALKLAEQAVLLGPSHREANLQRARLLTTLGENDAALEAWVKMTRIAADDHRGWVEAAALFAAKGKLDEASIHYDRACALKGSDAALWHANASVKVKLSKFQEALQALDGAERAGAKDGAHHKARAGVLLKLGRMDSAFEAAGQAARASPDDAESFELALTALDGIEPRRNDDYLKVADLLLRVSPSSERAAVEKARAFGEQAKWAESVEAAATGLAANPKSLRLWRLKAAAHKARGEREAVAAACEAVLEIDPKDKGAALDRGEALFDLGRFQDALEAYNALLMLDPAHTFAGSRRGQALQKLSRHREAVDAFDKVLARDKANVAVHRLKAESLSAIGKRNEAIGEMDVAIGFDPKNVKLWLYKAALHQQGGETDAAKRCFAKALEVEPANPDALTSRASLLLSRGLAKEALVDLDVLTRWHPQNGEGWLLFAEALEAVGRVDDARTSLEHALAINAKDLAALRQAGSLEVRAGRPKEGAAFLERAAAVDESDGPTLVQLGEALESSGDLEKALRAYEKARALLPDDRDVAGLLKNALRALRKDGELEALCLELIGKNLKDTDALFDLAVARRNLGKLESALEALDKLLAIEPNEVNALNDRGYVLSLMGRHADAIQFFSRALEVNPKAEHALVNKGLALRKLGEHREALACFRAACDVNGAEPSNWNLLGLSYSALDMHTKAIEAYDEGLRIAPADGMLLNNRGKALADTGDNASAVRAFESAAAANPRDASALMNLGICLFRLTRTDEAEAALERARELRPTATDVLYNLGRVKMEKRDFQGALGAFDTLVKESPDDAVAWENRGICLDNLDRFEEAVVSYDRSILIDPGSARTWKNKGVAYRSLKRYDDALPCFDKAHKIDPQDARALELRTECQEIIKEREVERYARRVLDFEFSHGRKPSREEAFKVAGVPIQHLDDSLAYLGAEPKLDVMSVSREELIDLERASAAVLKFIVTPEAAARAEPIQVTLAQLLHHFPETSVRRAKKILKYMAEVDRVKIDPKRTITPELEKAVQQAVEIPPEHRNLREVSVRLNAGILRSKRVLQILTSLERELDIPAHSVTIRSIKDAGWRVNQAADDLDSEEEGARRKRKVREEEPEFVFDLKGAAPVHAAPSLARELSRYQGGVAPDPLAGPAAQRPRVYCSACKIRGASHRHNECGEFLCDVCLERFNQVEHVTAGIKLLCPVCEQPIRDLGEATAKWDKL
jgi:tetratricopeptide (TPR) repeat protein